MNEDDCRARPHYECGCCSCTAEREGRDTDPAMGPIPYTPVTVVHGVPVPNSLREAAVGVLDAWENSDCIAPDEFWQFVAELADS